MRIKRGYEGSAFRPNHSGSQPSGRGQNNRSTRNEKDLGMVFPALELLVRVEVAILVIEAYDEADEDEVWLHVIEEGPPEGFVHRTRL